MNTLTSSPIGDAPSVVDVESALASDPVTESASDVVTDAESVVESDAAADPVADRFAAVPRLLQPALERKGFDDLTEVQRAVLAAEADGRDLQIFSQTGSGKTVALGFVLGQDLYAPAAGRGPEALIIVPTRELATQVCQELRWLFADLPNVELASVTGGHPVHLDRRTLSRGPRVLVGTPGRLLDHLRSGALELGDVRQLVLDEADQMLDMGFREELEGILEATNPERRTHLVSATFPEAIKRLAQRYQRDPLVLEGTRLGEANADIEHTGHLVRHHERYDVLVSLLMQGDGERTLIFVERRSDAQEVAERLEEDGFAALPLSGELAQGQRERTLNAFRNGQASVLVATDVAARGLDVPDVARVIHTAPPIDAQTYTHRSGRTGRAGNKGQSLLLAPPNRRRKVEGLLFDAGVDLRWQPAPNAEEVRAQMAAKARAKFEEELIAQLEEKPSFVHLKQAKRLLLEQDPNVLVAALLARLDPAPKAKPKQSEPREAQGRDDHHGGYDRGRGERTSNDRGRSDHGYNDRGSSDRGNSDRGNNDRGYGDRGREDRGGYGRDRDGGPRGYGERRFPDRNSGGGFGGGSAGGSFGKGRFQRAERGGGGGFGGGRNAHRPGAVRFFMNYGSNQGATPGRLLASICRRGNVEGSDVGSIAIHPNASTFDVSGDIAEDFERNASRRDARDPKVLIRRDRGPVHSS
jgi:ATP-dependent RNA helicase DeaD